MPSMELNRQFWGTTYDWSGGGDEWSANWGRTETQWHGSILPRIRRHLPVHTILEIAPGFGRWTQFLAGLCERLILVDLSEKCISACQARFRDLQHVEYHVNDGQSLSFVAPNSVDFVFSFDSLVHVEAEVVESYVSEIGRILKHGGGAFLHHSNLGEYSVLCAIASFIYSHHRLRKIFRPENLLPNLHGRAMSMSAALFRAHAERAGVVCVTQERIDWGQTRAIDLLWGGKRTIDCLSLVRKDFTKRHRPVAALRNPHFMDEASCLAKLDRLYGQSDST
jgi:SAM-dependent methyltransferase